MLLRVVFLSLFVVVSSTKRIPTTNWDDLRKLARSWEGFIVGGQDASPGQFPHSVSLRNTSNVHFCGGGIVANRWVICAAHCTMNRTPESTWIIVGALQLNSGGTNVYTNRIINHPDHYPIDEAGDISLLQTRDPIVFSATASPIALSRNYIGPGVVATVAGWGWIAHNNTVPSNTLQWINTNTISNEECYDRLPGNDANILQDNMVCTVTQPGEGMCAGDSGGVLFVGNTAFGIVSWGIWPCGSGYPDAFTRISTYYDWLMIQMES